MMRLIMKNRWVALLWVAMVAMTAARFAGKDGEGIKAFDQAASRVRAQRALAGGQQPQQVQVANGSGDWGADPQVPPRDPTYGEGYDPTPRQDQRVGTGTSPE